MPASCPPRARFRALTSRASQRSRQGLKLARGDAPALLEAHLLVRLAVGDGPVADARGVFRLPVAGVLEGEDARHERLRGRFPGTRERIGEDELLVRHNL